LQKAAGEGAGGINYIRQYRFPTERGCD